MKTTRRNYTSEGTDLHQHSFFSDGTKSPAELVRRAKALGLSMIALTDHDGVGGIGEAAAEAGRLGGLEFVPGIELSTELFAVELHILGLWIDPSCPELLSATEWMREARRERNERLIALMRKLGYDISYEELLAINSGSDYIGKPQIARLLAKKGYIREKADAFKPDGVFEATEAKKLRKIKLESSEAVSLIHRAGGLAVLAHSGKTRGIGERGSRDFYKALEGLIAGLSEAGLDGLEIFHPDHSARDEQVLKGLAEKYSLIETRGSDYHGD